MNKKLLIGLLNTLVFGSVQAMSVWPREEGINDHFIVSITLTPSLVPLLKERLEKHPKVGYIKHFANQKDSKKASLAFCLYQSMDEETFLEKNSFDAMLRQDRRVSKRAQGKIKHILNSFLKVDELIERGHVRYNPDTGGVWMDDSWKAALTTPVPDLAEYFESIEEIMKRCMVILGFKMRTAQR